MPPDDPASGDGTLVLEGRLVLPDREVDGWVAVAGTVVIASGTSAQRALAGRRLRVDGRILPGLVDIHCHGGAGAGFDGGADEILTAARHHRDHGTTTLVASLGSGPTARTLASIDDLRVATRAAVVAGTHLEGPFLSPVRRGAHRVTHLRRPDADLLARMLRVGDGTVRIVTLAPELDDADDLLAICEAGGVVAAVGHTDATAAQTERAVERGARLATHLFNGMRPLHHREGGVVAVSLVDPRMHAELVCDGMHVAPLVVVLAHQLLGRRMVLVTDACAASGMPDGTYRVGDQDVAMVDGQVRTPDGRSLAGSSLTLLAAVRNAVAWGVPVTDAVTAATLTPAQLLGLGDRGHLRRGARADLLLTDDDLGLRQVMQAGRWACRW